MPIVDSTLSGSQSSHSKAPSNQIRATIIDPPFPQLTELAKGLAKSSELAAYIHPFLDVKGKWHKRTRRVPYLGQWIATELLRRTLPDGVQKDQVHLAGTGYEIARYSLHHVQRRFRITNKHLQEAAIFARNVRLSKRGASYLGGANIILASHGTALEAFRSADRKPVLKVLDYPIAYYQYSINLLAEVAQRRPEYAATLQSHQIAQRLAQRLDLEIELADLVLVGSEFAKRSFIESGYEESKIVVVPYGADLSLFYPGQQGRTINDRFEVLFVGQVGQRKGIADLIDAYRLVRKTNTRLHLVGNFVGKPSIFANDRHLFAHTPHLPRWRLPEVYRSASVFVLPSYIEGMGLVVLEAMACGTPVIVSDRGPDQVVRDGVDGFIVPAGDVNALAERIEYLLSHPDEAVQMGRAAAERAREFGWDVYVANVKAAITQRAL